MTRKRAAELWPIIKAYGEGVDIQYKNTVNGNKWETIVLPDWSFEIGDCKDLIFRIKPTHCKRPMTRGEVLYMVTTTPGMVVREIGGSGEMFIPGRMAQNEYDRYEYAIIDASGMPMGEWKKFEVAE